MEHSLRCNNQVGAYCRASLVEEAIVTTCSHVFCLDCCKKTGLFNAALGQRSCPVCQTGLPNEDDAVRTLLKPTEEYKTSVLSGLDPSTIMECASRALSFWVYQTVQEINYQSHVNKNLSERYNYLSTSMDKLVTEANSEIDALRTKIDGLLLDQKTLQTRNADLTSQYREKSHKCAQALRLYDTLKKKVQMAQQIPGAAMQEVAHAIQHMEAGVRPQTYNSLLEAQSLGLQQHPIHSIDGGRRSQISDHEGVKQNVNPQQSGTSCLTVDRVVMPPPASKPHHSQMDSHPSAPTPVHRTALPGTTQRLAVNQSQIPLSTGRTRPPSDPSSSARRQRMPTSKLHATTRTGTSQNYGGISAGMKVSRSGTATSLDLSRRFGYAGHDFNRSASFVE